MSDLQNFSTTDKNGMIIPYLVKYRFRVNFSSNNPSTITELPTGWTANIVTTDDINVIHNLGKHPVLCTAFGYGAGGINSSLYAVKFPGSSSTVFNLTYDPNDTNSFTIYNATASNTLATSGTHTYIDLYFTTL